MKRSTKTMLGEFMTFGLMAYILCLATGIAPILFAHEIARWLVTLD